MAKKKITLKMDMAFDWNEFFVVPKGEQDLYGYANNLNGYERLTCDKVQVYRMKRRFENAECDHMYRNVKMTKGEIKFLSRMLCERAIKAQIKLDTSAKSVKNYTDAAANSPNNRRLYEENIKKLEKSINYNTFESDQSLKLLDLLSAGRGGEVLEAYKLLTDAKTKSDDVAFEVGKAAFDAHIEAAINAGNESLVI